MSTMGSPTPQRRPASGETEQKIRARSVSRGVAIGKVVCLFGQKRQFCRLQIKESRIESEIKRFHSAVRVSENQLKRIGSLKSRKANGSVAGIFDAQRLILNDASFLSKIENIIAEEKVNAEWAVKSVGDIYIAKFKNLPDEHLRSKYVDVEDIAERILTALGGGRRAGVKLAKDAIIVAKEIKPSTLIELDASRPRALVTEHGGWTSHTFILARELNLPAITGLRKVLRRVRTGDSAIVDALSGYLILNPARDTVKAYRSAENAFQQAVFAETETPRGTLTTLDGREIIIRANVDVPRAYSTAKRFGARGIGLYRSEFLFNQFRGFPAETEQIKAYKKIGDMAGSHGVRIRTFDISSEQLTDQRYDREKNPALGLRAIRLSLAYTSQFRMQLRSILIASHGRNMDIVLPMISDVSEIIQTKRLIERERELLHNKGIEIGTPRLGAMIETPSAVLTIKEIAEEIDFICIGTNDLVQYLLAVDRDNESVADFFRTLHPAVIRAIKTVLDAARERNISAVVCGEMAGSPYYAPLLIGLGATELSMNVSSIRRVRNVIAGIAYEETIHVANEIAHCKTSEDAEAALIKHLESKWRHLFSTDSFAIGKSA
jgi:phosphoenolpyruvate-protein phosphotransferase